MKISQNDKIIVRSILRVYLSVCVIGAIVSGAAWLIEYHRIVFCTIVAIAIVTFGGYVQGLKEINENKKQSKSNLNAQP